VGYGVVLGLCFANFCDVNCSFVYWTWGQNIRPWSWPWLCVGLVFVQLVSKLRKNARLHGRYTRHFLRIYTVSQKNCIFVFCQIFVKFPPILIILVCGW